MNDAPPSSRSARYTQQGNVTVTLASTIMRELAQRIGVKSSQGMIVPLIIHPEDAPELRSFFEWTVASVDPKKEHEVINPEDVSSLVVTDTILPGSSPHRLFLDGARTRSAVFERTLSEDSRDRLVTLVAFGSLKKYGAFQKNGGWQQTLLRRVSPPEMWPGMDARKADIPGIVDAICESITSFRGHHPQLELQVRKALIERPGERVAHLRSVIRKAFALAIESDDRTIEKLHIEAAKRPDKRANLRHAMGT